MTGLYLAGGIFGIIAVLWVANRILAAQREDARMREVQARWRAEAAEKGLAAVQRAEAALRAGEDEQKARQANEQQAIDKGRRDQFESDW